MNFWPSLLVFICGVAIIIGGDHGGLVVMCSFIAGHQIRDVYKK